MQQELYDGLRLYETVFYLALSSLIIFFTAKVTSSAVKRRRLTVIRKEAKEFLQVKKQKWWDKALNQVSEEKSQKITSLSFSQLKSALRSGQLKALDVLRAFQYRAADNDKRFNFVCEPIDEAEDIAIYLDSLSASEREKYPLFGIPLSVKENYEIAGYNSNFGCTKRLGIISDEDAVILKIMKEAGAVPFIRCNVPQSLLSFACTNPVYGITRNPHQPSREPGGSSGGDGVAVSTRSTVLAIGGDVGGSLRIPAAWCGHTTLKPTSGIISKRGMAGAGHGQNIIKSTGGPMAMSVDAVIDAMDVLTSHKAFQADVSVGHHPLSHEEVCSKKQLKIGFFEAYGPYEVCSAARRAVQESVTILKGQGHTLVPYSLPNHESVGVWFASVLFGDGGYYMNHWFEHDEWSPDPKVTFRLLSQPLAVKKIINFFTKLLLPEYVSRAARANEGVKSVREWWDLQKAITDYMYLVMADWKKNGLDAVICPTVPVPAMTIGSTAYAKHGCAYTAVWNVLNFPAGVVPVTNVTEDDVVSDRTNFKANDFPHKIMKKDLEGTEGLPMTVQVVTPPYHEGRCLRIMKELEAKVNYQ